MKFKIEINLGNDGMRTYYDVAQTLHYIAKDIHYMHPDTPCTEVNLSDKTIRRETKIRDENGNVIGSWKFVDE